MITLKAKNLLPLLLSLFIFLSCVLFQTTAQAADNHFTKTVKVQLNDGPREVKTVWIDMKDPGIRLEAVLAKGRIGAVDSFENIYNNAGDNETEVIAAINGNLFQLIHRHAARWKHSNPGQECIHKQQRKIDRLYR